MLNIKNSVLQKITFSEINENKVSLYIKREDLIHPVISGNKYRKLKYNIKEAELRNKKLLLTFGGAYSNHIAAVAAIGKEYNLQTVGIIRGEELGGNLQETLSRNPTLKYSHDCGMQFKFVSRTQYREKKNEDFLSNLTQEYGDYYLIPEGGTNRLAVQGCEEILSNETAQFDFICSAVGTGGTISGIINSAEKNQKVIGFSALKGNFLVEEIKKYVDSIEKWELNTDNHFGGYAKTSEELICFINKFKQETGIPLDPIYTGKMVYGVVDLINKNYFAQGSKILLIHTGGIQGVEGINAILRKKKSLLIK